MYEISKEYIERLQKRHDTKITFKYIEDKNASLKKRCVFYTGACLICLITLNILATDCR